LERSTYVFEAVSISRNPPPFGASTMRTSLLLLALSFGSAFAAAAPAAAQAQQAYHVVEVEDSEATSAEALMNVLTEKLGASKDKVAPLLEKLEKKGKAVMVAGSEDSCNEAAKFFEEIGMKTSVRPLDASDMPSEYDDSDVIVAGAAKLQELLESGDGILVTFFAPWCGHCKTMVKDFKEAATTLKEAGIKVAAIDGQASPQVAQQLGVRGYPTIKWLQLVPSENDAEPALGMADYNGARDAASFVEFAKAAAAASGLKSKLPKGDESKGADGEAKPESKLGASKVGGSKIGASKVGGGAAVEGVQKAKMPAEAAAEETKPAQEKEPEPVAA